MSSPHSQSPAVLDRARQCLERLDGLGYDFYTGVPCSLLNPIYSVLEGRSHPYFPATREDLAVGLAAGAYLGGRRPVVLMQNSGLGVSINALLSLQRMYALPLLCIVSWRGHGPDAPEHVDVGARMPQLLAALGIPWRHLRDDDAFAAEFHAANQVIALVVRPGEFDAGEETP